MSQGRIALSATTTTTVVVNIRQNSPDIKAPIIRKLQPNFPIAVSAIVGGATVQGNSLWFETVDGFVWAGACTPLSTGPAAAVSQNVPPPAPAPRAPSQVPDKARTLLDLIASVEAPKGYDTIFGNNQNLLTDPLTTMTVDDVIDAGPSWTDRFRSSACGRYQFMTATLKGLKASHPLTGSERFSPDLQDALGFDLLEKRGFDRFLRGQLDVASFGLALAQEWASFPVLRACQGHNRYVDRGETYYAGDYLNRALLSPDKVETTLRSLLGTFTAPVPAIVQPAQVMAPADAPDAATYCERISEAAIAEWKFFKECRQTVDGRVTGPKDLEAISPWAERIGEYWRRLRIPWDGRTNEPWSAAFISWCAFEAGAGTRFQYAARHSEYIHWAIANKRAADGRAAFVGLDLENTELKVGDIVGGSRGGRHLTYSEAANLVDYDGHCDIVVAIDKTNNIVSTIGGNLSNTVIWTDRALKPDGILERLGEWFVVIRPVF